jgi:YesN/AraC family two-component response regulator
MLVVEDNLELLSFIANSLSSEFHVITAEDGQKAYEYAKKYSPDLIVSDVMMPVMDGMQLCAQLKDNIYTSHIPIILLSAKAMIENFVEGINMGADDYISKPFNIEILKAKIKNLIESRKKLKLLFSTSTDNDERITVSSISPLDDQFLTKAYDIIEANFNTPEFSVETFSEAMFVSRSLLYKKLKALVDLSPNDFITVFRLKKSVALLSSGRYSINEVAYQVGFNDPKYFSRVFKKFYKKTPSEYLN